MRGNESGIEKVIRPVILIVALMVAAHTIVHLWNYITRRRGRVMVEFVVTLFSILDVAGLVTEVLVQDNQTVKGQVLFKIDVSRRAFRCRAG